MTSIKYVPKERAQTFLTALQRKFSKLKQETQREIPEQLKAGKMHLLVLFEDDKLKGGLVVMDKRTAFGPTAFVYGIFGTAIVGAENYKQLVALLKQAGYAYIQGFGSPAILRTYKRAGLPFEETGKNANGIFFGAKL